MHVRSGGNLICHTGHHISDHRIPAVTRGLGYGIGVSIFWHSEQTQAAKCGSVEEVRLWH